MPPTPYTRPTFSRELLEARAALTLGDAVGLALRAHRRVVGLSQRAYAASRGWSPARVARLEARAGSVRLDDVLAALAPTGFTLVLVREVVDDPPTPTHPGAAAVSCTAETAAGTVIWIDDPVSGATRPLRPVGPGDWDAAELVARVRGGWRRFPAHLLARRTSVSPTWWYYAESTRADAVAPEWTTAG